MPYLLNLQKNFTEYKSRNVMHLQSVFSIRIYEILKQYLNIGKRVIELETLREMLGISGKYPKFSNIKQRILEPAKNELSQTDISFAYEPIKTGRRVTAIRFTVKSNNPNPTLSQHSSVSVHQQQSGRTNPSEKAFLCQVASHGTDPSLARQAIIVHGLAGANEILSSALTRHQSKPKCDFAAYLAQSFRRGWGLKSEAKRAEEKIKAERMAARAIKFKKGLAEKEERERRTARKEEESQIRIQSEWKRLDALVESLPPAQYEELKLKVSGNRELKPDLLKVRMRKAVEEFLSL
jgi:hypothetical protein